MTSHVEYFLYDLLTVEFNYNVHVLYTIMLIVVEEILNVQKNNNTQNIHLY